jgi:DNA-binding SARP family transcriptional activator
VRTGEGWLRLGGPGQRSLLAALLLRANQVVSSQQLQEAIWGEAAPPTALAKVHAHVSALRHALRGPDSVPAPPTPLMTLSPGYLIAVEPDELDLLYFETLAAEGLRLLDSDPAASAVKLRGALSVWRGRPLEGVDLGGAFAHEAGRLEERQFAVMEARIDADLKLGRHEELIGELEAMAAANPLRERLHEQLMLAYYRAGRRGDALNAFRRARRVLSEELGLDPGPPLQRLEHSILTGAPELERPAPLRIVDNGRHPFPIAQLPPAVADLTGRDDDVTRVCDALSAGSGQATVSQAVALCVISGPAGVGKTALAVRAAHELSPLFPDGQLFLTLRESGAAVPSGDLLAELLRTLGVRAGDIPAGLGQRSQLYRSHLSGRRVLVVLDDATCEAQVRPLLPGCPQCAVLITGRARLDGIEGASRVNLGLLRPGDAVELLARAGGGERVRSEPAAAIAVAEACGHLPLALRIAGAKLARLPHWTLARMAERLADENGRLDELMVGDLNVRASLSASYQGLDPEQQRAFRLAGLLAAPDCTTWTVATLLNIDAIAAEALLDALAAAWLVEPSGSDGAGQARYSFHCLVRALARERALAEEMRPAVPA